MSTYLSLHYHLVFSTKNRELTIAPAWRARLHEYLGGTVHGLGGVSQRVGGIDDHVHLLVGLKATHCLADFMRELKQAASLWPPRTFLKNSCFWPRVMVTVHPYKTTITQCCLWPQPKTFEQEETEIKEKLGYRPQTPLFPLLIPVRKACAP
jgi:REP element-mobilizing transposase RayT